MDRDLNYSKPAQVRVTVHLDYGLIALQGGLALSVVGMVIFGVRATRRRRQRDRARAERDEARERLLREQEEELQTAHAMQMGLMPTESPQFTGLDVDGQCLPANHVSGDTFQYFPQDGGLTISLADVTGHAMEAAIPVVMFSGVLDKLMEFPMELSERFANLNRSLCRSLGKRTFICFSMAEIEGYSLRLANCGCPYPMHFHAGEVSELKVEGYPLGVRPDTTYNAIEAQLQPGDYVVFVSDGIPEAINADREMFGDERTQATVRQGCTEGLSSETLIERLLAEVRSFCGEVAQEDDMTCVVVRVE